MSRISDRNRDRLINWDGRRKLLYVELEDIHEDCCRDIASNYGNLSHDEQMAVDKECRRQVKDIVGVTHTVLGYLHRLSKKKTFQCSWDQSARTKDWLDERVRYAKEHYSDRVNIDKMEDLITDANDDIDAEKERQKNKEDAEAKARRKQEERAERAENQKRLDEYVEGHVSKAKDELKAEYNKQEAEREQHLCEEFVSSLDEDTQTLMNGVAKRFKMPLQQAIVHAFEVVDKQLVQAEKRKRAAAKSKKKQTATK